MLVLKGGRGCVKVACCRHAQRISCSIQPDLRCVWGLLWMHIRNKAAKVILSNQVKGTIWLLLGSAGNYPDWCQRASALSDQIRRVKDSSQPSWERKTRTHKWHLCGAQCLKGPLLRFGAILIQPLLCSDPPPPPHTHPYHRRLK